VSSPGGELGTVDYDAPSETLTLINRNTALARKVLLLGHSVKAQHADVAGTPSTTTTRYSRSSSHRACRSTQDSLVKG
jgi:hypothetical protein